MQDYILYNSKIKQRLDDGFYNIEADQTKLGLKGSPTRVWKSFTKGSKAAGQIYEVDAEEAVDIILEKLKEKFII